jgi:nitroreductase
MSIEELLAVVRGRRSVRAYKPEELNNAQIEAMIESIRWAPSAGNYQCREFFFVREAVMRQQLAEATFDQDFVAQAPLVIVCCTDRNIEQHYGDGSEEISVQDVSASIQNLLLVIHGLGLGACWIGAFSQEKVRELLDLPPNLRPLALISVGQPDEAPEPPDRRSPETTVRFVD